MSVAGELDDGEDSRDVAHPDEDDDSTGGRVPERRRGLATKRKRASDKRVRRADPRRDAGRKAGAEEGGATRLTQVAASKTVTKGHMNLLGSKNRFQSLLTPPGAKGSGAE